MLYCTSTLLLFVSWRRLRRGGGGGGSGGSGGGRAHAHAHAHAQAPRRFALPGGERGSLLWLVLPSAVVCAVFASNLRAHAFGYAALLLLGGAGHGVARCRDVSRQQRRGSTVRRVSRCLGSM